MNTSHSPDYNGTEELFRIIRPRICFRFRLRFCFFAGILTCILARIPRATAAVTGTIAIALRLMGRAAGIDEAQAQALAMWEARDKSNPGLAA